MPTPREQLEEIVNKFKEHAAYKEKLALYRELFPSMRGLLSKMHRVLD